MSGGDDAVFRGVLLPLVYIFWRNKTETCLMILQKILVSLLVISSKKQPTRLLESAVSFLSIKVSGYSIQQPVIRQLLVRVRHVLVSEQGNLPSYCRQRLRKLDGKLCSR